MAATMTYHGDDPVAVLQRWEDAGAHWRVLFRDARSLTVGLFRCDGGDEMDRLTSSDPRLVAFVADRDSSAE